MTRVVSFIDALEKGQSESNRIWKRCCEISFSWEKAMGVEHSTGTCIFLYCVQYLPLCTCIYTCACRYHTEVDCLGIGERKVMLKFGNLQQATPWSSRHKNWNLIIFRERASKWSTESAASMWDNFNLCKFRLNIPPWKNDAVKLRKSAGLIWSIAKEHANTVAAFCSDKQKLLKRRHFDLIVRTWAYLLPDPQYSGFTLEQDLQDRSVCISRSVEDNSAL